MLKFTIKTSIHSLLHISVHLDHPQGAYAVPFVELSVKYIVTSFAVLWQHVFQVVVCVSTAVYYIIICLIKDAFVGEKNFNIIKMHGTTIKNHCTCLQGNIFWVLCSAFLLAYVFVYGS
jgi:hypothetical protein